MSSSEPEQRKYLPIRAEYYIIIRTAVPRVVAVTFITPALEQFGPAVIARCPRSHASVLATRYKQRSGDMTVRGAHERENGGTYLCFGLKATIGTL